MGGRYPHLSEINCKYCGELFKPKSPTQSCCSFSCARKSRRKSPNMQNCLICGKELYVKPFFIDRKKYCSLECRNTALSINRVAENNPMWNGGTDAYKRIAFRNFEQKCDICGKDNVPLDVHHKDFDPEHKNNDISNLQILCKKCHYHVHAEHRKNKNAG